MKWLIFGLLLVAVPAAAQVELAELFTDNMVIQRNQPITVWGKGWVGEKVEVEFGGKRLSTRVHTDSTWSLVFKAMRANTSPQLLEVNAGSQRIIRRNILIGDVWLCSGQSNMEWAFSRDAFFKEELAEANQPLIRLYNTSFAGKYVYGTAYPDSILQRLTPESFYSGRWENCTDQTVLPMSAVGYYFAKRITGETGVPVGLINLAIGGAPIETFIDSTLLANHLVFRKKLEGDWLLNPALPAWVRERGRQNLGAHSSAHAYKPGFAFASAIPRLSRLPIAGCLFYQGESNSLELDRVHEYGALLQLLVASLRNSWKRPDLPFYYAQLSSIDTPYYASAFWPQFRNIQRQQLDSISYSGMAVTSDVGNARDVHPRDKRTVGYRLAAWALYHRYGKRQQVFSGPQIKSITARGNRLVVRFRYTAGRLQTSDGNALSGFSLDGVHSVSVLLRKKKLIIPFTVFPTHLYYGWSPYSTGNLVNGAGLPASTFFQKINSL